MNVLVTRNDHECNHTYLVRHWQCSWAFHVETDLPAPVLIYFRLVKSGPCLYYFHRNHVPWAVISACLFTCLLLILLLRFMLARENRRRETEQKDERHDVVFIIQELADGTMVEKKVDRAFLDLTDLQNLDFRYAL